MSEVKVNEDGKKVLVTDAGTECAMAGYVGQVKNGYMCRTDFFDEVGRAPSTGPVYAMPEDLMKDKACAIECGWVRVLLIAVELGGK